MKLRIFRGIATMFVIASLCGLFPTQAILMSTARAAAPAMDEPEAIESSTPNLDGDWPKLAQYAEDGNKNVGAYIKAAVNYLKKQGWNPNAKWSYRYFGITRGQDDLNIALIYDSEENLRIRHDKIQAACKKAGLPGYGYFVAGLAELSLECKIGALGYNFYFSFQDDGKNVRLLGGYISAYSGYGEYGNALEYEPLNSKAAAVTKNAKTQQAKLEKELKAVAVDKIAALDFMGGVKASDEISRMNANIFQNEGWSKTKFGAFYSPSTPILSKSDWDLARKASKALKNAENYGYILDSFSILDRVSYYCEKKYKIGDASYYIDFCIAYQPVYGGSSGFDASRVSGLFLLVKPAKANSEGKLDHFFYPADTSNTTIGADMKGYFAGKQPSHCMK